MWAPLLTTQRGHPWMFHDAIARTRRESKRRYLEGYYENYHRELLRGVKFVRVLVTPL